VIAIKFICRGQIFCPMPRNLRAGHCLSVWLAERRNDFAALEEELSLDRLIRSR
jgi:hypothetical protein